jgi:hypothetical protein
MEETAESSRLEAKGKDKGDRINRIDTMFCFSIFRLPAIASRSGEAGEDESAEDNPLARR